MIRIQPATLDLSERSMDDMSWIVYFPWLTVLTFTFTLVF
jgi:hypothetical protein